MTPTTKSVQLGIGDHSVQLGSHVAYFWETTEEFDAAIAFLARGLSAGDHLVVFGYGDANTRVCQGLESAGLDCEALEDEGRLSVIGPNQTGDEMLHRLGETFQAAVDAGAPMIRLLGNIGWGRTGWPDETDLLRFEARVTRAAASFPCVVVCMYDVASLRGSVVFHGAFCTHPLTIYRGNLVRENPMCVDVEEFLEQLEARAGQNAG